MKIYKLVFAFFIGILFIQCQQESTIKPTAYMVGDSTVKNGRGDGAGGLWGWGDFIGQYLDSTKINVENHALGGTSSRTYQNLGLWDTVYNKLNKGDYVFIQFGHNDNGAINDNHRARGTIKGIGEETEEIDNILTKKHEIVHSYGWYIRKIVTQAKEKGAIPIIMSPIPRNKWKNGKVPRNDKSYGLWAKQIAEEENVTFVDLNKGMVEAMNLEGEEKVTGSYFYKKDHTHTSAKGAVLASKIITDDLSNSNHSFKEYLLENPTIILPRKKNIFLIGDSTMAQSSNENTIGWGMPFPTHFDTTRVTIINKARGGRSTRSFNYEGLWDAAKEEFKEGDFVLIQFGHNDAGNIDKKKYRGSLKGMGDETQDVVRNDSITETVHTYGWYLKKYIRETKEKGAIPIVISLTPRNEWPNGKAERRADTYVKWSKEAAEIEGAFYIDLNELVAVKFEALGKDKVKDFFPQDHTHTNIEGASLNALTVTEELKKMRKCGIRDYIVSQEELQKLSGPKSKK